MMSTLVVRARSHPGLLAALLNRVSGILLALFLPAHFIVLGLALKAQPALEHFLVLTRSPPIEVLEAGLVAALALHLACGLRILAIEFLNFRERTAITVSVSLAFGFFFGILFLMIVPIWG